MELSIPYALGAVALLLGGGLLFFRNKDQLLGVTRGRTYTVNGVLHGPEDKTYRLTDNDLLWLARALVGEVGASGWSDRDKQRGGAAVIWALAQNFMLVIGAGNRRPRFSTFTNIVRAYCQPVNPAWMDPNGAKCQSHPDACTPARLNRRRQISSMSWNSIPPEVRDLVTQFKQGSLDNPVIGMTDWHARTWNGALVEIAGNHFGVGRRNLV
jgi:hypothetical protein